MHRRFAILVTLAACHDPEVERLTAIKAEVCACQTASCAEQAMQGLPGAPSKPTHRKQAIARAMLDCLAKLPTAELPTTDPDAEDPSAEPPVAAPPVVAPPASAPGAAAPASTRRAR